MLIVQCVFITALIVVILSLGINIYYIAIQFISFHTAVVHTLGYKKWGRGKFTNYSVV